MDYERYVRQMYMIATIDKVFNDIVDEEDYNYALKLMADFWSNKTKGEEK